MALNFWEVRHGPSEFPPLRLSICLSQSPPNKYMYIYMYVYMLYIYIYMLYIYISLSLYIYIYIYPCLILESHLVDRDRLLFLCGQAQILSSGTPRFIVLCPDSHSIYAQFIRSMPSIHSIYALNSFDLYPIPSIHSIYAQILSSGTIITVIIIHY